MKAWLDWGLGITSVDSIKAYSSSFLGLEVVWPLWVWLFLVTTILLYVFLIYSRYHIRSLHLCILIMLRTLLITSMVIMLCQPIITYRSNRISADTFIVMIDNSGSMQTKDVFLDNQYISRLEYGHLVLRTISDYVDANQRSQRQFQWYSFADTIKLENQRSVLKTDATDKQTHIITNISSAINDNRNGKVSGMITISDGQESQALIHHSTDLRNYDVPTYHLVVGEEKPIVDVYIDSIEAPDAVYPGDQIPVNVIVNCIGISLQDSLEAVIQITDKNSELVAERKIQLSESKNKIEFIVNRNIANDQEWSVKVNLLSDDTREIVTNNNQATMKLSLVRDPIRVLYVDGYPRWEQRYLKNMLIREKSVLASTFLFSADKDFAQEGNMPIQRLPRKKKELSEYDVVIIGDISPHQLPETFLHVLKNAVSNDGLGVIFIAGDKHMPHAFSSTVWSSIFPMQHPDRVRRHINTNGVYYMTPTSKAKELKILDFVSNHSGSNELLNSPIYYGQDLGELKISAQVISQISSDQNQIDSPTALDLIAWMRYGRGSTMYIGSDELWRLRYGIGERYYEQLWLNLIRLVSHARTIDLQHRMRFTLDRTELQVNEIATIHINVNDESYLKYYSDVIEVDLFKKNENGRVLLGEIGFKKADKYKAGTVRYVGEFATQQPGYYQFVITTPDGTVLQRELNVLPEYSERINSRANHEYMKWIADQTGGDLITIEDIPSLLDSIPSRATISPHDFSYTLLRSPGLWFFLIILITVEWVYRKILHLA